MTKTTTTLAAPATTTTPELTLFDFAGAPVRAFKGTDGQPQFIAGDLARVLGYRDAANMTRNLEADEKGTHVVSMNRAARVVRTVTQSGAFAAILASRRPEAIAFRRFVTEDVLPILMSKGSVTLAEANLSRLERTRRQLAACTDPEKRKALEATVWHLERREDRDEAHQALKRLR